MSSQFIIRNKKKKTSENDNDKNIIILKEINMIKLDREFAMNEIKKNTSKKFTKIIENDNTNPGPIPCNPDPTPDNPVIVSGNNDIEKVNNELIKKPSINSRSTIKSNSGSSNNFIITKKKNEKNKEVIEGTESGARHREKVVIPGPGLADIVSEDSNNEIKTSSIGSENMKMRISGTILSSGNGNTKITNDLKSITTKLEHLGISNDQRNNTFQSLIKNDSVNVRLYSSLPILKNEDSNTRPDVSNTGLSKRPLQKLNINCWWCKHIIPSDVHPIGCPVKYYKKDISKNIEEDFFETDGIFCSFNCTLSYINEVSVHNIRYRESGGLLYILYKKIFNCFPPNMDIKAALDWKLLKIFGGIMNIEEFRNSFQKLDNLSLNYIKTQGTKNINVKQTSFNYIEEVSKENSKQHYF